MDLIRIKLNRFVVGFISACLLITLITACVDQWAIGKSAEELNEELARSIFEVDSLILTIQHMYGDSIAK